jgi:DNA-binding SARP family transcriptional activator
MIASASHPRQSRRSSLRLLEEFRLFVDGEAIALPHSVERVVAFLGVSPAPVGRVRLATTLWPDVVDHRAYGDLRSALWWLRRITGVIEEVDHRLALTSEVYVDLLELRD